MGNIFEHMLQGQQQPHGKPRTYRSMQTHELLTLIKKEFSKTLSTIQQMRWNRQFDGRAREFLCQLMRDSEQKLCIFNQDMIGKSHLPTRRQQDADEIQALQQEVNRLRDKNDTLEKANVELNKLYQCTISKTQSYKGARSAPSKRASVPIVAVSQLNVKENTQIDVNPRSITGGHGRQDKWVKDLQDQMEKRNEEITALNAINESSQAYIQRLMERIDKLEDEKKMISDEKENLALRLSKMAGQRLVLDNPGIADLSDPNRPTKLGEFYSEIYDNEWTDAFEAITKSGYDDKNAIITLRLTLINALEFCKNKSDTLLQKTEDAVNFLFEEFKDFEERKKKHLTITRSQSQQWLKEANESSFDGMPDELFDLQEMWRPKEGEQKQMKGHESVKVKKSDVVVKQLKVFRKEVAESMVPIVQKAYISASWKDAEFIPQLKPFIKKCIFLGWMMVVQSPPMALATCKEGVPFDKNMFKEYTKSGSKVNFVVWPALLLHENGPILGKGVAEGRKG